MNKQLTFIIFKSKKIITVLGSTARNHRYTLSFVIGSSAIIVALLLSGTYLNPVRNEQRYNEEVVKINYKTIDQSVVQKLQATQYDKDFNISPQFVPNRNNPFSE